MQISVVENLTSNDVPVGEIGVECNCSSCVAPGPPMEKEMAPHSSTLAWKIPWMEEPGRLQSMGSLRAGYD